MTLKNKVIYLKGRERKKRDGETKISSFDWFIPQMAVMVKVGPGQSQKFGTSLSLLSGCQNPGMSREVNLKEQVQDLC